MTLNHAFLAALALALFLAAAVVSFVPLGGGTGPFGLGIQRTSLGQTMVGLSPLG